jgi:hypothetical protein
VGSAGRMNYARKGQAAAADGNISKREGATGSRLYSGGFVCWVCSKAKSVRSWSRSWSRARSRSSPSPRRGHREQRPTIRISRAHPVVLTTFSHPA